MSDSAEMLELMEEAPEDENCEKFLVFSIMGKLYSFPSRLIGEIALFDTVYPLPLLPPYVLGVVNRYSVPYALFDIGILFYQTPCPRKKIIIFKDEIDRIAILIDDISGIAEKRPHDITIMERNADNFELTDSVVASFVWNEENVFVLDIHRILGKVTQEIS
ncbi:MAG: chemotaxis protein CheW [Treponema sp.]|nr:chemotaxis protein CheW [Treponema sp.]MCL2236707.1 chemotaxis protein CheW [Treponema sp.]